MLQVSLLPIFLTLLFLQLSVQLQASLILLFLLLSVQLPIFLVLPFQLQSVQLQASLVLLFQQQSVQYPISLIQFLFFLVFPIPFWQALLAGFFVLINYLNYLNLIPVFILMIFQGEHLLKFHLLITIIILIACYLKLKVEEPYYSIKFFY